MILWLSWLVNIAETEVKGNVLFTDKLLTSMWTLYERKPEIDEGVLKVIHRAMPGVSILNR